MNKLIEKLLDENITLTSNITTIIDEPCKFLSEIDVTDNVYQKQIKYNFDELTQLITLTVGVTDEKIFDVILEIENRLNAKIKVHTIRHTASNLLELKYILSSLNKEIRKINASCFFFDNNSVNNIYYK